MSLLLLSPAAHREQQAVHQRSQPPEESGWSATPLLTTVSCWQVDSVDVANALGSSIKGRMTKKYPPTKPPWCAVFSLCSWTGCPRLGEALDLADFKTKKADIDSRRVRLEQAEDQALRL